MANVLDFSISFFFLGGGVPISQPNYSKEYKKNISIAANLYYYNVQYGVLSTSTFCVVHVWNFSFVSARREGNTRYI